MIVVFPPPDGPTSPIISPGSTENDTPFTTCLTPSYPKVTESKATAPRTGSSRTGLGASRTSGSVSSTSKTRWAELVARFITRAIWPITSMGCTYIVMYRRKDTNVPGVRFPGLPGVPRSRGTASAHTAMVMT